MLTRNSDWEILTPNGWKDFHSIQKTKKEEYISLIFDNGEKIKCSTTHPFSFEGKAITAQNLSVGNFGIIEKETIKEKIILYDPIDVSDGHLYYSNGLISHNTEFLGSGNTLISGSKLRLLTFQRPISSQNNLDVYQEPIVDTITDAMGITIRSPHKYVLCADTAQGKQLDYSAFVVMDVTESPYKLVAKYRSNVVSTILFPDIIYDVARRYNDAWVLVEINDSREVTQSLHYELEYENILTCTTKGRAGQILSAGFTKNPQLGVKMSTPVKKIGCATLKSLVETDRIKFVDYDIVAEFASFVQVNKSYAADPDTDAHDDLIMCLVIFAWLVQQKYFKELVESDLRSRMKDEFESQMEHDMLPFGFIINGLEDVEPEVVGGDVWFPVQSITNW